MEVCRQVQREVQVPVIMLTARCIVDLHRGQIRVERRQPNGCRMVVVLPSEGTSVHRAART